MDQDRPRDEQHSLGSSGLSQVVPLLQVANMERSLEYYREALGFKVEGIWPADPPARWAHLSRDAIRFILSIDLGTSDREFIAEKGNGVVLYLVTDQLDALYAEFTERGAIVVQDLIDYGGRRQFSVGDADGYLLAFSEPFSSDE